MPKKPDPYRLDDENPELTWEEISAMRPASEVLPPRLYASLTEASTRATQNFSLPVDRDVLERLQAFGNDWQDYANALLRKAVGL